MGATIISARNVVTKEQRMFVDCENDDECAVEVVLETMQLGDDYSVNEDENEITCGDWKFEWSWHDDCCEIFFDK